MRAVLDPNVLVSALLSRASAPARILGAWLDGEFELVVSNALLAELARALAYAKVRAQLSKEEAEQFVTLLRETAQLASDPPDPPRRSPDPGDDYLLALARSERALLVSGDRHLLGLRDRFPIESPRTSLETLERGSRS